MFEQFRINLRATYIFVLVRLVASALVGLVYILVAAAIQYFYVSLLGETTFNYIVGGGLSLFLGSIVAKYFGDLLFMFIRGWNVAALAYADQVISRNLPSLEVGMTVYRKHFTSFATIYGARILIRRFAKKGTEELWKLLSDVPYLCSLERFAKNPVVVKLGSDILDTAFDGVVYYTIKYTKPGISDDLAAFPTALRKYIYALPKVMLTSIGAFILLYVLPKIIRWVVIIGVLFSNGLVAGVLINVLLYPVFYIIRHGILDFLEMLFFMSCYSEYCSEDADTDENDISKNLVDKLLIAAGFEEYVNATADSSDPEDIIEDEVPSGDNVIAEESVFSNDILDDDAIINVSPDTLDGASLSALSVSEDCKTSEEIPSISEDFDISETIISSAPSSRATLHDMINNNLREHSAALPPDIDEVSSDDEDDKQESPVTRLGSIFNALNPESFNQVFDDLHSSDEVSGRTMGGDDFDFK